MREFIQRGYMCNHLILSLFDAVASGLESSDPDYEFPKCEIYSIKEVIFLLTILWKIFLEFP